MIRPYQAGDEKKLKENQFSDWRDQAHMLSDPACKKYTVTDGDAVFCIVVWFAFAEYRFGAFLLVGDGMKMTHVRELKRFIHGAIIEEKSVELVTYSVDCDVLNRWHDFLGFTLDTSDKRVIDGKSFNKWVIKNGH